MDSDIAIFWFVCLTCVSGLFVVLARHRSDASGWVVVYLGILLVNVAGWLWGRHALIFLAAALWVLLVMIPGLLGRFYYHRILQQKFSAARRLALIIRWLHPADGWREQPSVVHALEMAQRGELAAAMETLKRFQDVRSAVGMTALVNLYRLTNQWEELLAWHARQGRELDRHAQLLPVLLRALGETGDVRGMVGLYDRHRQRIGKIVPAASRDLCRLMLFAFCGRRRLVERLFAGSLALVPVSTRTFWLATADLAAGSAASARDALEPLLNEADPTLRTAVERRLARISIPPEPLDAAAERVLEEAAREQGHDESFGGQRSLFSKQARATQILILLNVMMFVAETCLGGGTDLEALFRLGALYGPAVLAGEWWRLIASLFLHFGLLHLAMNMLGLAWLGPFTEFALGFRRFLLVYLLAGIGSMGVVMSFASGPDGGQLTVGASGCIMGLVGATGALMLRGWWREKALTARRRLIAIAAIVAMQCVFDSLVPQVSMTAHLSGAIIGFAAALMLRNRLGSPARSQALAELEGKTTTLTG